MKEGIFYETASGQKPIEGFLETLPAKEAQKVAWLFLWNEFVSFGSCIPKENSKNTETSYQAC